MSSPISTNSVPDFALQSPLLQGLNPEQQAAVGLPPHHALIVAGAGSGKTRVLTTRIAWLLQTSQVSPGGILAVTFTNKAAKEMKLRLQSMLPVNVNAMWIGTFHGLCNRFLRAHHQLAGLPQTFQILDTQDQLSAVKRLCKQFNVDEDRFPPKQVQYFISGCKEDGQRPGDVPVRDTGSLDRPQPNQCALRDDDRTRPAGQVQQRSAPGICHLASEPIKPASQHAVPLPATPAGRHGAAAGP